MKYVIFCAAVGSGARHGAKVSARLLWRLSTPGAGGAYGGWRASDTAWLRPLGRAADDTSTQERINFTHLRAAKARPNYANPCVGVNESGGEATFPPSFVTSALHAVTLTSQARDAKYIFAWHIPSVTGICATLACNVRQSPPFFPLGNSLSWPVECIFDRPMYSPSHTETPPAGNPSRRIQTLVLINTERYAAHLEIRGAQ